VKVSFWTFGTVSARYNDNQQEGKGRSASTDSSSGGIMAFRAAPVLILLPQLFLCSATARAQNAELEACRTSGLIALKERNSSISDLSLDMDSMTVAKANTKVEDTPIRTIVIGDAYLEQGKRDARRTFLCLIGEKGKVLLTFFTEK
jgi:hypothetical protein